MSTRTSASAPSSPTAMRARGNVSLSPGTPVGPKATLHSGVHAYGHVGEGVEVVR